MKRILLFAAVLLFATGAFAQAVDRDVLVTPDGTVYTVESVAPADVSSAANSVLELTSQNGSVKSAVIIPDSTSAGTHTRPALAYDLETRTLFVLWLHMPNMMSSELLLAALSDGTWQPAVSIDNQPFHLRYNLRIGITRRVSALQTDGTFKDVPVLLLHLLWWEETGNGEEARYALLDIEKGKIASTEIHSLSELYAPDNVASTVDASFNPEILRHPAFLDSGAVDSVDVIAGDVLGLAFHRLTIKPILDTRIRIPVGHQPDVRFPAPTTFSADWSGHIGVIGSSRGADLVFAHTGSTSVSYLSYTNGTWSAIKSIELSSRISTDSAMAALSKMLAVQ